MPANYLCLFEYSGEKAFEIIFLCNFNKMKQKLFSKSVTNDLRHLKLSLLVI